MFFFVKTGVFPLGVLSIYNCYLLSLTVNGNAPSVEQKSLNLYALKQQNQMLYQHWVKTVERDVLKKKKRKHECDIIYHLQTKKRLIGAH